ncbi:hypothetical protein Gpo141_00002090, partial [Globisporangium polare]
ATDNSELKHEIQFWLDKFGTEKSDITANTPSARRALRGVSNEDGQLPTVTFDRVDLD